MLAVVKAKHGRLTARAWHTVSFATSRAKVMAIKRTLFQKGLYRFMKHRLVEIMWQRDAAPPRQGDVQLENGCLISCHTRTVSYQLSVGGYRSIDRATVARGQFNVSSDTAAVTPACGSSWKPPLDVHLRRRRFQPGPGVPGNYPRSLPGQGGGKSGPAGKSFAMLALFG